MTTRSSLPGLQSFQNYQARKKCNEYPTLFMSEQNDEMQTFMLDYSYKACESGTTEKIVEMTINCSGIQDTARVLNINKNTVTKTLKKRK
jgi:hypothetical protein